MSLSLICHMSKFRNDPCHYILNLHVACHYASCHMWNLRKDHVDRSILGVKGHMFVCFHVQALHFLLIPTPTTWLFLERVPIPVIPIQGWTLLLCEKGGLIVKFEAPDL